MKSFALLIIFAIVCLFLSHSVAAQSNYYQDVPAAGKGYWKVFTDHKNRSTLIKFYNQDKQLVYEEVIRGKYIKLTRRNIRLLNQELDRLLGKELIASKVKSTDLMAYNQQTLFDVPTAQLRDELKPARAYYNAHSALQLNTHIMFNSDKLKVIFENPQREKIKVSLQDGRGAILYEENISLSRYSRDINLHGMAPGSYRIKIKGRSIDYSKSFELRYTPGNYQIQILPHNNSLDDHSFHEAID